MRGNRRSLQFDNSCLLRSQVDGGGVILIKKRPQSYSSYAAVYDEFEEDLIETDFKNTSLTYCTLAASTKKTPNKNKSLESASLLGPIEQTHEPPNVVVSGTTKQTSMPKESRCAVLTFTKSKELKINNCNGRDGGDQMPPNPPTTPSSAQPQQPTRRRRFDQFLKSIVGKKSSPSTTTSASSPSTSSSTAIHREPVHTAAVLNHDATSSSVALLRSPLPDIHVSDNPDAHHRSHHHLDEDDENVSLTHSMSSVQQKLWNVVPVFRREGSYSSLHNSYAPQQSRSTSFQDQPSMCGGKATTSIDLRKCETMLPLNQMHQKAHNHHRNSTSSNSNHHTSQGMRPACSMEPIKPSNRLRNSASMATCSRCSSLLSLAANGSRYSLNIANSDFVSISKLTEENAGGSPTIDEQFFACKLCLAEVSLDKSSSISQCGCSFCTECMIAYVEFEIMEGAYEISCPDALCAAQGIISLLEIEKLASTNLVEKHQRYRLNREVDIDKYRTWCPRAGCDTVCFLPSSSDRDVGGAITNQPSSSTSLSALTSAVMQNPCGLQCPTCDVEFCSNCKETWHPGSSCEDNIRRLAATGQTNSNGIQFNSDLIKCCPMCSVPIEKDEGCAQMMCKRCKHVFCWYCLASLDDDFLLRHYDKGPCKNKLGHSRASVVWHRAQVIGIFAGFGILLLVASPLLLLAAPCIVCCKCKICSGSSKMEFNESEFNDTVAGL